MDLMTFLQMGGYARFVWPAFLITAVVLYANVVWARRREAAVFADLRRRRDADRGET
jgi:heme exporter protein CcmD